MNSERQIEVQLGKQKAIVVIGEEGVGVEMMAACATYMSLFAKLRGTDMEILIQSGRVFDTFRAALLDILRARMTRESAAGDFSAAGFEEIIRGLIHFEEVRWAEVDAQGKARVN